MGDIPPNQALRRDAAHIGDDLWVSGVLGDARLALGHFLKEWVLDQADFNCVRLHLEMPIPRVHLGLSLRGIARAALDISDGLVGDLKHILDASKCGAILHVDELPLSTILNRQPIDIQRQCALYGGDDYELCFSASPEHRERIKEIGQDLNIRLTQVGYCVAEKGLHLYDKNDQPVDILGNGFDHFLT
jgi:thiamine-monophosphate kinase